MTTTQVDFLDGPAEGVRFDLLRVPEFLRIGVSERGLSPLSHLNDKPRDDEEVVIYRKLGMAGPIAGYAVDDELDPDCAYDTKTWRAAVTAFVEDRRNRRRARKT